MELLDYLRVPVVFEELVEELEEELEELEDTEEEI